MKPFLALILVFFINLPARAFEQGIAVDYLLGEKNLQGIRLAYRPLYMPVTTLESLGQIDLYWEVSANFWQYGDDNRHETNYLMALSPYYLRSLPPLTISILLNGNLALVFHWWKTPALQVKISAPITSSKIAWDW